MIEQLIVCVAALGLSSMGCANESSGDSSAGDDSGMDGSIPDAKRAMAQDGGVTGAPTGVLGALYETADVTTDDHLVIAGAHALFIVDFATAKTVATIPVSNGLYWVSGPVVFSWGGTSDGAPGGLDVWSLATGVIHISDDANAGAAAATPDGRFISYFAGGKAVRSRIDGADRVVWSSRSCLGAESPRVSYLGGHFVARCDDSVIANDGASPQEIELCRECTSDWPTGDGDRVLTYERATGVAHLRAVDGSADDEVPSNAPYHSSAWLLLHESPGVVYATKEGALDLWHPNDASPISVSPRGVKVPEPWGAVLAKDDSGLSVSDGTRWNWLDLRGGAEPVVADSPVELSADGTTLFFVTARTLASRHRAGGTITLIEGENLGPWRTISGARVLATDGQELFLADAGLPGVPKTTLANDVEIGSDLAVSSRGTAVAYLSVGGDVRIASIP